MTLTPTLSRRREREWSALTSTLSRKRNRSGLTPTKREREKSLAPSPLWGEGWGEGLVEARRLHHCAPG
jgi:hypothetical protein